MTAGFFISNHIPTISLSPTHNANDLFNYLTKILVLKLFHYFYTILNEKNMLRKLLLLSAFALPISLFAQQAIMFGDRANNVKLKNPESVIGQVLYDFTYISDTTEADKPQKEIVALDFSNNYSKFYSQTYAISDSLFKADMARQFSEQQGSANLSFNARGHEGSSDVFIMNKKKESVNEIKSFVQKQYLISDGKHTIDWDIQDSTKSIGNYTCQKAIGTSRGRQYIVWFTTDLPYSFGPRRLNGLPGLILEAYDLTDRIVYRFKEYNTVSGKEIGIPEDAIASTEKEYADMQVAFKANPSAFFNASRSSAPSNATGGDISKIKSINIVSGSPMPNSKIKKKVINFPIDLAKD